MSRDCPSCRHYQRAPLDRRTPNLLHDLCTHPLAMRPWAPTGTVPEHGRNVGCCLANFCRPNARHYEGRVGT